jgi:hypothetical protein
MYNRVLRIESVLQEIMPLEAYASFSHEVPYTYQLTDGRGTVTMVGMNHTYEYPDAVFTLLDDIYAAAPPTHVILEGVDSFFQTAEAYRLIQGLSKQDTAKRGGEAIYALKEALVRKIPWTPAEPADDQLYSYLLSLGFSKVDILAWQLIRLLPQYLARNEHIDFEVYTAPFIALCKSATKWSNVDYSYGALMTQVTEVIGSDISDQNIELAYSYTDPTAVTRRDNDYTIFNTLSATANVLRDRTMVTRALKLASNDQIVLVVCGAAHAVMQEPAYRTYFQGHVM